MSAVLNRPLVLGALLLVVLGNLLLGIGLMLQSDPAPAPQGADSFGQPLAKINRAGAADAAENARAAQRAEVADKESVNIPDDNRRCRYWGPFEDESQAEVLLGALVRASVLASIGAGQVASELLQLDPDHLIFIGPYDDQAAARKIRDDLLELGSDSSVVSRTGQLVVSVGVFSQRRFADAQIAKLQDWGFAPQRRELARSQRVFFVTADLDQKQRSTLGDASPQLHAAGNCQTIASQFRLL